jgi:signal transduction histidine kinase/HAMP domain-containing protein
MRRRQTEAGSRLKPRPVFWRSEGRLFGGMRRLSLASLLIALNAGFVLVAVVGVALGAVRVLRTLADQQALARVRLAAESAEQAIERTKQDVVDSANLLAERSVLPRLVASGDRATAGVLLERFRRATRLSGCAAVAPGRLVATRGSLPWPSLKHPGGGKSLATQSDGTILVGGSAPVPGAPTLEILTALRLDTLFSRRLSAQIGLPVEIVAAPQIPVRSVPQQALRTRALEHAVQARIDDAGLYLAARPLHAPDGSVVGIVECALPTSGIDASAARLVERLLVLALLVATVVLLLSAMAGRWFSRAVRELASSAARIGRGDLATPIGRAPGAELGTLAISMDEMRRDLLRLTAELRLQQAEGQAVLTGIAEGVFSVDRDRKVRYLNPQAAQVLGIAPDAAIGRFCGDLLNPRRPDGTRPCEDSCPIVHARFQGASRATEQLQLADGSRRSVVITSSAAVEDRQMQVLRDETDLESARRQRDLVLANISHEFKTPLAAQRASLELLHERIADLPLTDRGAGSELESLVFSLERGALRLTQLIDNLLESVRIESGQVGIRTGPVALDEVVEEAIELTAPLLGQRGQRLAVELPYPLPEVRGDAPRLIQVFVNLIANANKFSPADSQLTIGGLVEDRQVRLWVEDEGPGLPPALETDGPALFGRFVRSPSGVGEPEQSGMGLGLWIVQSIVERHGGSVEALRRPVGTRMQVSLPRLTAGDAAA